ncbi:hypothetical protein [Nocardiopsis sp. LOL_012]|uniref:hypothetical protein n=1 Tax=Nocardiopsis sp. LOL_012 TaxID=3345409 RepID=UPI003A87C27A
MPRSREQTPRVPYMSLPPSMRRRRLEEHHRRRVSEETRWALLSVLLLVTGLSAAVFAGAWALENRALDTRFETTTAQAVWFVGENQYFWYERDGVWRVDPALSDTSYPHGTAVTVEVVPGSDPLVAIDGVRHPSGEAAVVAVSCLVLGTAVYLLHSKASTGRFRLFRRRGLVQLGRGLLMPIRGAMFSFFGIVVIPVLVPLAALTDPEPVDDPRLTSATVVDVWHCEAHRCEGLDGEVSHAVRGTEYVRDVHDVVADVGEEVEVLYGHDDPGDVVTVKDADTGDRFAPLIITGVILAGFALFGPLAQPFRALRCRRRG